METDETLGLSSEDRVFERAAGGGAAMKSPQSSAGRVVWAGVIRACSVRIARKKAYHLLRRCVKRGRCDDSHNWFT